MLCVGVPERQVVAGGVVAAGGVAAVGSGGSAGGGADVEVGGAGCASCAGCAGCMGAGAGGSASGCAGGCATCSISTGPSVMTFVGTGKGEYITETSWKYVGKGEGIYSVVAPRRSFLPHIAMLVSLVLLVILAVLLWPRPHVTTTTTPAPTTQAPLAPIRDCLFWGDPHIKSFDGARLSFYGDGEFWVVKSEAIKIQGLYMGTKWTHGLAATSKIVVSGAFVQGHKIVVGSLETGAITVDGLPVLSVFPSTYNLDGIATLSYNGEGQLVDNADHDPSSTHIVHMDLPGSVRITVMRWKNYIDFKVEMPQQPSQDGSCGNFNGRVDDDTTVAIMERIGARVADSDLLFPERHIVDFTPEMQAMLTEQCTGTRLAEARAHCQAELPVLGAADQFTVNSCLFDNCFGYNEHALSIAKTYGA